MLIIRDQQMSFLNQRFKTQSEEKILRLLFECYPEMCGPMGAAAVKDSIRDGIERAAKYGIISEYDVTRFINVRYALDRDFDENPEFGWAKDFLEYPEVGPTTRMDWLCEHTRKLLPRLRLKRRLSE